MEKTLIEMKVPSDICYIESVLAFTRKLCETLRFPKKRIADIQLTLDEICSNAVHHGSPGTSNVIQLQISVGEQTLEILVRDTGKSETCSWLTHERLKEIQERRSPSSESGHGLYIIECLTDEHKLQPNNMGGTDVTAIFYR